MRYKKIVEERFEDYKKPSLYIGCISCGGKCAKEGKFSPKLCINNAWQALPVNYVNNTDLIFHYLKNPITTSIVFGLLEPMEQADEIFEFIRELREDFHCSDDVVIYSGYTEEEFSLFGWYEKLRPYENIIVKFGRYIPNRPSHFDEVLGVNLASENQYAVKIS
jgi:hypothetical protein